MAIRDFLASSDSSLSSDVFRLIEAGYPEKKQNDSFFFCLTTINDLKLAADVSCTFVKGV